MVNKSFIRGVKPRLTSLVKLNIHNAASGFLFFIAVESGLNMYSVERFTELSFTTLQHIYFAFYIIGFIFSTIILSYLVRKLDTSSMSRFLLAILWFLYFHLCNRIFTTLFPFTYLGDVPSAGTRFVVILGILLHYFYLIVINRFAIKPKTHCK